MDVDDRLIVARNVSFGISKSAQHCWLGGDFYNSAMFDCFSIFFPEGERFFVRSLKHHARQIDDPDLRDAVRGYTVQEAFHMREHEDYNQGLRELGYDVDRMEQRFARFLHKSSKNQLGSLAKTCAIEHITFSLASVVLRDPKMLAEASAPYRRIWLWHALEETEHAAVAVRVWNSVTAEMPRWKRYALRVSALFVVSERLWRCWILNMADCAKHYGVKPRIGFLRGALRAQWIDPGLLRRSLGLLLRYLAPGFDPEQQRDAGLIDRSRVLLDKELRVASSSSVAPR